MYENDKKCCLKLKNIDIILRRTEGPKEFIWVKCRVCKSIFLKSKTKNRSRVLYEQKI